MIVLVSPYLVSKGQLIAIIRQIIIEKTRQNNFGFALSALPAWSVSGRHPARLKSVRQAKPSKLLLILTKGNIGTNKSRWDTKIRDRSNEGFFYEHVKKY
jgi:hypothetical protein